MISIVQSNKKFIAVLFLIFFGTLIVSSNVFAFETKWPSSPVGTSLDENSTLSILIRYLYEWMIAIGGLAAFSVIVFAGIQYLTSSGDPGKIKGAKDMITSAIGGLLLLLSSFLILNIVNPELTILKTPEFTTTIGKDIPAILFEESNILGPCEKVTISYSSEVLKAFKDGEFENNQNNPIVAILTPGKDRAFGTGNINWKPVAFDVEGVCLVNLYTNINCAGDAKGTLSTNTPDIYLANTGLSDDQIADIECISVE